MPIDCEFSLSDEATAILGDPCGREASKLGTKCRRLTKVRGLPAGQGLRVLVVRRCDQQSQVCRLSDFAPAICARLD